MGVPLYNVPGTVLCCTHQQNFSPTAVYLQLSGKVSSVVKNGGPTWTRTRDRPVMSRWL